MHALLNRMLKVVRILAFLNTEENRQLLLEDGSRIIVE